MNQDVKARRSYQYMLAVILIVYVLIIINTSARTAGPLRVAVLSLLLFQSLETRRRAGKWLWPAAGLVVAMVAATITGVVSGSDTVLICTSSAATGVLVLTIMAVIAKTLIAARVIDGPAVRGVLCVYLLFALLFASIHQFSGALITHYLNGVSGPPNASDALYFSVITLATVGYGDITPVSSVARAFAVAEALIGQLYLVSVVAAVVGRYRSQ